MVPVSIQVRQALSKLVLPVLLLMSVGIIIAGQADRPLADRARMRVADVLAPLWSLLSRTQTDPRVRRNDEHPRAVGFLHQIIEFLA